MAVVAVAMVGCKTDRADNPHVDLKNATAPTITPSQQNVIALQKDLADSEVTFAWSQADYGYNAAVKYQVQMDVADGSFEKPVELGVVNGTSVSLKVGVFNAMIVNQLQQTPDAIVPVKIRVASFVSDKIAKSYSEEAIYYVNTYQALIIYPSLGIPGSYKAGAGDENWAPENMDTRIYSANFDKKYEGFTMMTTSDPANKALEFKFVDGDKWGDPELVCPAPVLVDGVYTSDFVDGMGGNIAGVKSGFYNIKVDLSSSPQTLWMKEIKSVGITGDCTTPQWSNTDPVELKYNYATYAWEAETELTPGNGEFLVLLNNNWDMKWGQGAEKNQLKAGGDNAIGPEEGGKYKIIVKFNGVVPTFEYIPL